MIAKSIVIAVSLAFFTSTSQATLIVNGGFEAPDIPTGSVSMFPAGIPGWSTISGPGIEIQDNVAGSPFEGDQFVELDSSANSGMRQTVSTVANQQYQLSLAFSARPNIPITSNGIDIFWDGAFLANITADGTSLFDTSWAIYNFSVVASSTSTDLDFVATGTSDSLGGYIDDVNLTIPEPSTIVIWSVLAMLGFACLRRRDMCEH